MRSNQLEPVSAQVSEEIAGVNGLPGIGCVRDQAGMAERGKQGSRNFRCFDADSDYEGS